MSTAAIARHAGWIFAGILLLWIVACLLLPPVSQPQAYHAFADTRAFAGIPNFWNVVSNAAILLVGLLGLHAVTRHGQRFVTSNEAWPYACFFAATVLVALGSTYYHLAPDDARLLWDRLPIALATVALPIALFADHAGPKVALPLLLPALLAGAVSALYWRLSALQGQDNLVPYLLLQLLALGAVVLLASRPGRYTRVSDWWIVIGIYVLARLAEVLDAAIYRAGGELSGHTITHYEAAFWVLRMIRLRRAVSAPAGGSV
jgi:hypothetical protein